STPTPRAPPPTVSSPQPPAPNEPAPPVDYVPFPLGRPENPYAAPQKITAIKRPSDSWVMTDCDVQLLTGLGITSATYMDYIAKEPVHGAKRPALRDCMFYDWSVRPQKNKF